MISQNKYFFSICFSEHVECSFDDSAEKLPPKLRKKIKNAVFLRWKYFPSNSSGHVKCSFENLDRKFHQKSKTFPLQVQKKLRYNPSSLSKKPASPKCFAGHTECRFDNADQKNSLTVGKNFAKRAKNENFTKITFSVRILLWICSLQFYNSAGSSSLEVRKSKERNKVFLKKNFFLDFFFWTCRVQLWRLCRETSAQTPKENQKHCFFSDENIFLLQILLDT